MTNQESKTIKQRVIEAGYQVVIVRHNGAPRIQIFENGIKVHNTPFTNHEAALELAIARGF